jgi:hypothetical protein
LGVSAPGALSRCHYGVCDFECDVQTVNGSRCILHPSIPFPAACVLFLSCCLFFSVRSSVSVGAVGFRADVRKDDNGFLPRGTVSILCVVLSDFWCSRFVGCKLPPCSSDVVAYLHVVYCFLD